MGAELIRRHVELFNEGVRSGDFGRMLDGFTEDAELVFEGVPVGPFSGRISIAEAYRSRPPDDEIRLLDVAEEGVQVVARYAWRAEPGRSAGRMILTPAGDRIAKLIVTFESD